MSIRLLLALSLTFVVACGDDSTGTGDDDDDLAGIDAGNPDDPDAFVPPGDSFTLDWGPLTIPPGQEDTRCVVKRLGNTGALKVHQIHNFLGDVSHHFIVYKTSETQERHDPFPCDPFVETLNADGSMPLMITQRFEETLTLPDGVAFVLEPNQMIRLELHYINATDADEIVHPTTTFIPLPDEEFTDEAGFLFMGDVDIDIAPMSFDMIESTFISVPSELNGSKYFAITGHVHQWGTNVKVDTASSASSVIESVYDVANFDWDEPETIFYEPPFTVPDNGGFEISCEWYNGSKARVGFGEGANDEMCFFWTYYYPSKGARVCFQTDALGGTTACCPGHVACGIIGF